MTGYHVFETESMTGILGQLKWESLKKRRKDSRLILLYKGLKGNAKIHTGPDSVMVRAFASEAGGAGSNPGRVIPKTLKMVPVATLLGAQH